MVEPPDVFITRPTAHAIVKGTVIIQATGSDDVTKIEMYIDGFALAGSPRTSVPWELPWETTRWKNGGHKIVARAIDADGNVGRSEIIVDVRNET